MNSGLLRTPRADGQDAALEPRCLYAVVLRPSHNHFPAGDWTRSLPSVMQKKTREKKGLTKSVKEPSCAQKCFLARFPLHQSRKKKKRSSPQSKFTSVTTELPSLHLVYIISHYFPRHLRFLVSLIPQL